jgi:hypothetical protein
LHNQQSYLCVLTSSVMESKLDNNSFETAFRDFSFFMNKIIVQLYKWSSKADKKKQFILDDESKQFWEANSLKSADILWGAQ